jgi:uncharacterized protein
VTRGALAGLARWPVKSMAGERLRAARLDARDGQQGRLLTASRAPRLLAWAAAYPEAPDDALDPAAPPPASLRAPDGTVWGWEEPGLADALGADLGVPVELRREPAGQQDLERSVLVTTEASRRALEATLGRPVDLRRFRTNLHLDLDAPAFAEERWQGGRLQVGPVTLDLLHPCARCVIPTRDPDGDGRWPALRRHLHRARAGLFGINARVAVPGRVALGDRAAVTGPTAVP